MNETVLRYWWMPALRGVIAIAFGVLALALPAITLLWLVALFAAYALFGGVLELVIAIRLRRRIHGELLMVGSGLASIVFGTIVFLYPLGAGALALVWLVGFYAIATGVLPLALALRVRRWARAALPGRAVPGPS